jgi:hypothetical protein
VHSNSGDGSNGRRCLSKLNLKPGKIMHALFLPLLAMDPATTSGAVVLLLLSAAALIRSKMP